MVVDSTGYASFDDRRLVPRHAHAVRVTDPAPRRWTSLSWRPVVVHPLPASLVGVAAAVTTGIALIPLRDDIGAVNAALVMAAIIVLAAEFGGRVAGIVVGVAGSLAFNVFHTAPYGRLVIEDSRELIAAVLLVVFGVLVGTWHRKPPR